MNEIANKAAYYARIAQYASDGFSQVYLGAKDVAPTTDNTGNPLIVGALYFNTVSDILYVWDGSVWDVATNFNETTPFLSTGSTTARTLANRFADVVNVKDFGAVGDGVVDDTAAIQAALNSSNETIIIPSNGSFLVTAQININASNKSIIGLGGKFVRGSSMSTNVVINANNKNNLTFDGLIFKVQSGTPHDQNGGFVLLDTCNNILVNNCVFDAERKDVTINKESLFSAINTPSCNNLQIIGNKFLYLYGNGCGANDGIGNSVNGHSVSVIGNLFYNCVDTGCGNWTGARDVTISGNIFNRDDYSTSYDGVHVDIAGATKITVNGNTFRGNTIGVRMLSNLGYTNNGIVISGNVFAEQTNGASEPATGIRIAHYTNGSITNNEDLLIRNNTFKVSTSGWGVNIVSTVTDTSKTLTFQIDGNSFDLSNANAIGVFFQRLLNYGNITCIPGANTFIGNGSGSFAVSGLLPNGGRNVKTANNIASHKSTFNVTATGIIDQFYMGRGLFCLNRSLSTCTDPSGVGGLLSMRTKSGVSLPTDEVISAASSNTQEFSCWNFIATDGVYQSYFTAHPSGNNHNYDYIQAVRLI